MVFALLSLLRYDWQTAGMQNAGSQQEQRMARKSVERMPPAAGPEEDPMLEPVAPPGEPVHSTTSREAEFARRLQQRMGEMRMTNSDLARAVWGEMRTRSGHRGAKGRDRISVYLKGQTMPGTKTLQMLCEALQCSRFDLDPMGPKAAAPWEQAEVSLQAMSGHPDKTVLKINRVVSFQLAVRILNMLAEEGRDAIAEAERREQEDTNGSVTDAGGVVADPVRKPKKGGADAADLC